MTIRPYISILVLPLLVAGCKSSVTLGPSPAPTPISATIYPARPTAAPAVFKIFHHGNSSFTLVVNEKADEAQLSSLVWQLRDAARASSFDSIHIPQSQVDADGKTVWFHIYRGTKCAPEKYAPGKPPCGASYHAAADYTLDTHSSPPWDKGALYLPYPDANGDHAPIDLWNPDAPYNPATK